MDCVIAFPEKYTETGEVLDTFELPTEEGIPVIIEHEWSWGSPSGVSVRGPKAGLKLPPGDQTISCTMKTVSGPPVRVSVRVSGGYIAEYGFKIAESAAGNEQRQAGHASTNAPGTARDLVDAIASSTTQSELLTMERRLFLEYREAASNLVGRLADSNPRLRESAAAFARWFPGSVTPFSLAKRIDDAAPRVGREARYSMNILLFREGKAADQDTARELVPAMLRLFIEELCRNPNYDRAAGNFESRRAFLSADEIAVLDDNVLPVPQLEVETTGLPLNAMQSFQPRARIRFSFLSLDEFAQRAKGAAMPAVQFHAIKTSDNFARVAMTGMPDGHRWWGITWVALFEKTNTGWRLLAFPPYNEKYYNGVNYSNMNPLAPRDFGVLSPLDTERFMFGMESIKVTGDFDFRWATRSGIVDSKYETLLRLHLADSNQAVRTAVCLGLGRMGREDVVPGIVDLCADTPNKDLCRRAVAVLQNLLVPKIQKEGKEASHAVLSDLLAGADAYLAREKKTNQPDVRKATAKATVLDAYAVLDLRWEHHGLTLLCQRRDDKWRIAGSLGGWVE
jgi:hypothetical protein